MEQPKLPRRELLAAALAGAGYMTADVAHAEAASGAVLPRSAKARQQQPLPKDLLVIDPVIHAFNLTRANQASRYGEQLTAIFGGVHATWNAPEAVLKPQQFAIDTPIETLVDTVFLETSTTLAAHHCLRLDTWFKDGLCSEAKTIEGVRRWPNRVLGYIGLDPTQPASAVKDDFLRQLAAIPTATGIKLYPHQVTPYRRWRADDDSLLDLFGLAQAKGIRTIAIHKAMPNGSVPLDPYRVDDIDGAADAYPDLNFEIIHAGMSFLEETAWAINRFPNVYANLETTTALLWKAPGYFEDILSHFVFWGGTGKIVFSSGVPLVHSQRLIEAMWNFQFTERSKARYGELHLSEQDKRAILGLNYARLAKLDPAAIWAGVKGDRFDLHRSQFGLDAPFSNWRKRHPA